MAFRLARNSYRIGRRAGQQGLRSPVRNQAGIKSMLPDHQVLKDHPVQDNPQNGLLSKTIENSTKGNRQRWTREEYKDVMEAFYTASLSPTVTSTTIAAYNTWRDKRPTDRLNLDANKFSNVRRDIIRNK